MWHIGVIRITENTSYALMILPCFVCEIGDGRGMMTAATIMRMIAIFAKVIISPGH